MFLRNSGTGALTVAGSGGNTINGSATIILQPSDSCIIVCSGSTFYTVGLGKSTQFAFTQLTKAVVTGNLHTDFSRSLQRDPEVHRNTDW
jgi:hypothetical protein